MVHYCSPNVSFGWRAALGLVLSSATAVYGEVAAPCLGVALRYCRDPALSCPFAGPTWVALHSGPGTARWRCYSPTTLTANHSAYKSGTDFCTRDAQILQILRTCKLPPRPPPPVYSNATEVFVPGEGGYPCIRIPSIALAGDNQTLNAFAECRRRTGDGCEPLDPVKPSPGASRDICQKQSSDGGKTVRTYVANYVTRMLESHRLRVGSGVR